MPPSWIVMRCVTGRGLEQRRVGVGALEITFPSTSPLANFCLLTSTPLANFPLPQPSTVTKSKIAAYYENVHSHAQNMLALQAMLF